MKFPGFPIPGRSVAESFRELLHYVRSSRIVNVVGGAIKQSPNGSTLVIGSENSPQVAPALPPFWARIFYSTSAAAYKLRIEPGVVRYHNMGKNADASGPTHYLMPTLSGTALDDDTKPTATVSQPYIYVKVLTDNKGVPTGTPTIEQESAAKASTHHRPPDPDDGSGETGEYYFLIAKAEQVGSDWVVKKRYPGNLNIPNQLVEQENLGYGAKTYKGYSPDAADVHQFRSLSERASGTVAIQVDENADEIEIHGTGVDDTVVFQDVCGNTVTMVIADGLVSSITYT